MPSGTDRPGAILPSRAARLDSLAAQAVEVGLARGIQSAADARVFAASAPVSGPAGWTAESGRELRETVLIASAGDLHAVLSSRTLTTHGSRSALPVVTAEPSA